MNAWPECVSCRCTKVATLMDQQEYLGNKSSNLTTVGFVWTFSQFPRTWTCSPTTLPTKTAQQTMSQTHEHPQKEHDTVTMSCSFRVLVLLHCYLGKWNMSIPLGSPCASWTLQDCYPGNTEIQSKVGDIAGKLVVHVGRLHWFSNAQCMPVKQKV